MESLKILECIDFKYFPDNTLGMHWQIHKDSNHFFHEYKKAGKKMPVSIGMVEILCIFGVDKHHFQLVF